MKGNAAKVAKKYGFPLLFMVFILVSRFKPIPAGIGIGKNFWSFFLEMIFFLPLMFVLIGLFDVWIPRYKIEHHVGRESGIWGIVWVILLATLQGGPLYTSFPIAALLWKKGCSIRNIFIYLGAFSALKIPMLAFEIGFLGIKFSILRTLFSLPVFIAIGCLLALVLKNKSFTVKEPG